MNIYTAKIRKTALAALTAILLITIAATSYAAKTKQECPPSLGTKMTDITFVAFDTETTGFSPTKNRILELGAVKFKNGKIIEEKNWLINPKQKISYWAEKAHGISSDDLKNCPEFSEVYPEFEKFVKGCVLFAHNARFDVSFIGEEVKRAGLEQLCEPTLDTLHLFRTWWPDSESHTVKTLADMLNIKAGTFHRATDDSRYTIKVFDAGTDSQPKKYTYSNLVNDAGGEMFFGK